MRGLTGAGAGAVRCGAGDDIATCRTFKFAQKEGTPVADHNEAERAAQLALMYRRKVRVNVRPL